jgi:hypothetical protein
MGQQAKYFIVHALLPIEAVLVTSQDQSGNSGCTLDRWILILASGEPFLPLPQPSPSCTGQATRAIGSSIKILVYLPDEGIVNSTFYDSWDHLY